MKSIIFWCVLLLSLTTFSQEVQRKSIAVTVYNQNIGIIKDVRTFNLEKGKVNLAVTDVAESIDPTSVHIKLDGEVLEQNYQYDLVGMFKILSKYIDKNIQLIGEKSDLVEGKLLSAANNQIVIQKKEGGLVMLPNISKYNIVVDKLPEGLITRPTLLWMLNNKSSGKQDVEISYQTAGLNWHAEYVAVLNEKDTQTDLKAWVSVENNSGATYEDAKLKLVAGNINLVQNFQPQRDMEYMVKKTVNMEAGSQFEEKSFFEYHIYDLQRPATINNAETKQLSLFDASNIKITKKYLYRDQNYGYYNSSSKGTVNVVVEFENKEKNNLGMPMPAGKVRLYKSDGNALEFIGEDRIEHTPKDETVKLKIGDAFDITAEQTQTDTKKITDKVYENSFEIKFKNHKSEDVTIDVEKSLGYLWQITNSNYKSEKKDANTVAFSIPVAKDGEATLKFTVRYSY